MKGKLIKTFWPILNFFETDEIAANYKKLHRIALNVMGTPGSSGAVCKIWGTKKIAFNRRRLTYRASCLNRFE